MYRPKDSWGGRPTDDLGHLRRETMMNFAKIKSLLIRWMIAFGSVSDPAGGIHLSRQVHEARTK